MRTVLLLLISWAAGLAAYGSALLILRGEVLSLDNWMIIGSITLVAWLVGALAWALHVAIDRAVGYGLRTPDGFQRD